MAKILKDNEEFIKRKSLVFLAEESTSEFITYLNKLSAPKSLISSLIKEYTKKAIDDYLFAELLINKNKKIW